MAEAPIEIVHNADAHRFEAHVDGGLARCDYRRIGNVLQVHHTEVPVALEGRGIASQLVRRHPEYQSLLAAGQTV